MNATPSTVPAEQELAAGGTPIATYCDGSAMDAQYAPRPYLHPVRTPGGTVVTDIEPEDHPHHWGMSLAIPDVDGTQFWGGRTYVDGQGYVWLDNEGTQKVVSRTVAPDGGGLDESLEWVGPHGDLQLREQRTLRIRALDRVAYVLEWRSVLSSDTAFEIGSPATEGRVGVGYGGLFWRFPGWDDARVHVEQGEGPDAAYGADSRWLAVSSAAADASVVLVQSQPGPVYPWFARTDEYLGVCPALAWEEKLPVGAGEELAIGLDSLILDGRLDTGDDVRSAIAAAGLDRRD